MRIIKGIIRVRPAWLALGMTLILVAGCYQPASIEPQQPTIGGGQGQPTQAGGTLLPTPSVPEPTEPPPAAPTMPPIAATATALVATYQASGVELPTQPPSAGGQEGGLPLPSPVEATPTPVDDSPLVTPTQLPIGPAAEGCVHVIQPGETLFSLARQWHTTVDEIAILNGIANPNNVAAGTELKVPRCESGEVVGSEEQPAQTGGGQIYVVQPGDTVFGIARRFGVAPQDIINANPALRANPDQLSVGQELIIP